MFYFSCRFGKLSLVMSLAMFPSFCCLSQFLHRHGGLVLISGLCLTVLGCHGNAHLLIFLLLIILKQFYWQPYPNPWYSFFFLVYWVYLWCFLFNFPRFSFLTPIFFFFQNVNLPAHFSSQGYWLFHLHHRLLHPFCWHHLRLLSSLSKPLIISICLFVAFIRSLIIFTSPLILYPYS